MTWNRIKFAVGIVVLTFVCLAGALVLWWRPSEYKRTAAVPPTLRHDLVLKNNLWYTVGKTNPFTGVMVDYYPGGVLLSRCEICSGRLEGLSETWYTNGQMQVREYFKQGVSDGLREKWHENGARLSQATIIGGKVSGTFRSWYPNGQLNEQIEMSRGRPVGTAWAYYSSGCLKAETLVQDGGVISRKLWKDGERKPARAL